MEIITLYELNFTTFDEQLYYMNKSGGRKIIWRACNGKDQLNKCIKKRNTLILSNVIVYQIGLNYLNF